MASFNFEKITLLFPASFQNELREYEDMDEIQFPD